MHALNPFHLLLALPLLTLTHAHSHHDEESDPSSLPWAHRHLRSEHHIFNYDPGAFFTLHDFDNNGFLTRSELLKTYGLPLPDVPREKEDHIWDTLLHEITGGDADGDGEMSREEWMSWSKNGGELPDFGVGIGHHGDDEYEYEIHHFEKYHTEEDGDEKFVHKEDIEHVSTSIRAQVGRKLMRW